jgi:hypothetical protein
MLLATSPLLPQAAAARIEHLTQVTERHIQRYRATVADAQRVALLAAGLPPEAVEM